VKDRVARALVEDLEASGRLAPDSILLEATSGNTGIALAMIGRRKGYRVAVGHAGQRHGGATRTAGAARRGGHRFAGFARLEWGRSRWRATSSPGTRAS
jgi:hypothetical protein